ncbi:MAG TPA: MarR family transcriptional regulator [Nitrolancea sp.]|nr:MarR family transcriptional regulator [Nitrolancea sp.]
MNAIPPSRIDWLSDLVRLEITLWNRVDARLRDEHDLPLAYFWPLYVVGCSSDGSLRVGELATALRLTVGGTSKIVDRIERIGLLRRAPDAADRRASRVALTDAGRDILAAAGATYDAEMAALLDTALSPDQQREMHALVRHLLATTDAAEPDGRS